MDVDFSNCTINVTFPDYVKATTTELINTWGISEERWPGDRKHPKRYGPPGLTDKEIKEISS